MCNYCKLNPTGVEGEKTNDNEFIDYIKEGRYLTELSIYRYADDDDQRYLSELILSNNVVLRDGTHTVEEKHIKIKYCPFCGEEL